MQHESSAAGAREPRWLDATQQQAWRAYLRASRLLEVALDRDLAHHGTQLSEYEVVSMLSEAPAGRMRISASNIISPTVAPRRRR